MPDIDYGQILEALNDKTDRDLGNLSAEGRVVGGGLAFPSSKYVQLTAAQSTDFVAPADGFFVIDGKNTNGSVSTYIIMYIFPSDETYTLIRSTTWMPQVSTGNELACYAPVKKGDKCQVRWYSNSIQRFIFVYAEGSNN